MRHVAQAPCMRQCTQQHTNLHSPAFRAGNSQHQGSRGRTSAHAGADGPLDLDSDTVWFQLPHPQAPAWWIIQRPIGHQRDWEGSIPMDLRLGYDISLSDNRGATIGSDPELALVTQHNTSTTNNYAAKFYPLGVRRPTIQDVFDLRSPYVPPTAQRLLIRR